MTQLIFFQYFLLEMLFEPSPSVGPLNIVWDSPHKYFCIFPQWPPKGLTILNSCVYTLLTTLIYEKRILRGTETPTFNVNFR